MVDQLSRTHVLDAGQAPRPELRRYLQILGRRRWVVVAIVALITGGTAAISATVPKTYQAQSVVQIKNQSVDTSLFMSSGSSGSGQASLAPTVRLLQTPGAARRAALKLPPPRPMPRALLGQIAVTSDDAAAVINIIATTSSPISAAQIANAFANAAVEQTTGRARELLEGSIRDLQSQVSATRGEERTQLSRQLQRLRALRSTQGANAAVIESAIPPGSPSSPDIAINTVLAFLVSLLLAVALAFVLEQLDRRLRSPEQIEEVAGQSLLAAIPTGAFKSQLFEPSANGTRALNSHFDGAEAFRLLRTRLLYFNVTDQMRSILVTSCARDEGKTTVATSLAAFSAQLGMSVVLVDADLRRPRVAASLGMPQASRGLSDVLSGQATSHEVSYEMELGTGSLRVIPSGPPPPNPAELMSSPPMASLLKGLQETAQLVIIDAPPILAVSDALPLVDRVSGVVAVARVGLTRRDALMRLLELVPTAGGKLFGIVGTGVDEGAMYGYGVGYGYGSTTQPSTAQNGQPVAPTVQSRS